MRLTPLVFLLLFATSSDARIGETSLKFIERYGGPKDTSSTKISDKQFPLVEGAIHHTYEYQGWKIRAAFLQLDGPAVRMDFQKLSGAVSGITIKDYELEAIMTANTPAGMKWKPIFTTIPTRLTAPWANWAKHISPARWVRRCGNGQTARSCGFGVN